MAYTGAIFQTTIDSEVIAYHIARERLNSRRPLCIGKRDHTYILASETCALDTVGASFVRDVEPREIVTISPGKGIESDLSMCIPKGQHARCVFEYISPDRIVVSIA